MKDYLVNIQNIDDCGDEDTPLDQYDSECHAEGIGNSKVRMTLNEEELLFMVNVSEQVKRPEDMLMFLGEYFKETIETTQSIHDNLNESDKKTNAPKV